MKRAQHVLYSTHSVTSNSAIIQ